MWNYLKVAFLERWNLLAFLGGAAFAVLSGYPDVLLPIILAGEISYVGLLGSHPKFQAHVDARAAKSVRDEAALHSQQSLQHMLRSLPRDLLQRFQTLRGQCLDLQQISQDMKRSRSNRLSLPFDDFQTSGLDRLLWIHLRLLYTQYALSQFLEKTRAEQIEKTIAKLEEQIKRLPGNDQTGRAQRTRAALEDTLQTSRDRLANWNKANDNHQLIGLELDRLENKIRSISERAVNRQEPEFITSEVDHVASSLLDTERTMNELQFATGLAAADSEPPSLLRAASAIVQK
jgi:ribosome-associated translation inhibitor RaiA